MLHANNFTYGLVTPVLGYLMSCLGAFLGLGCVSRALAASAASRARWLVLGAVSFGTTGIWVMHFIAMLGYTIPGQIIRYSVPITILSMVIAVVSVGAGLFLAGFGNGRPGRLVAAGVIIGGGTAAVHFVDMAGMRMPADMDASLWPLLLSVLLVVTGAIVLVWVLPRLSGGWPALGAALIVGGVVTVAHYTSMAATHVHAPATDAMGIAMSTGGATAVGFLLPLIIGISIVAFILTPVLALSPTAAELQEEAEQRDRIGRHLMDEQPSWTQPAGGRQARPVGYIATTSSSHVGYGTAGSAGGVPRSLFTGSEEDARETGNQPKG
jgi:NO-binding membrane sensor protein with MHYT domain